MSEFIFDLQRFDGTGSSSGASGGTGGGSSSGGSNAKTDGDTTTATAETWKDDWKGYSAKDRSVFAAQAYATAQTTTPTEYVATDFADNISVSGLVNNVIYGVNRFDTINFVDLNLESFATFANYLAGVYYDDLNQSTGGGYVDLIFSTGTVTRLYLADTEFTPTLNFASGLSEVYSFDLGHWFSTDETSTSTGFWNRSDILNNYVGYIGTAGVPEQIPASQTVNNFIVADNEDAIYLYDVSSSDITEMQAGTAGSVPSITSTGTVENVSDKAVNFKFKNGTSTLIYYDGTFSPNVYFGSGEVFAYNSKMGAWRTPEEIQSDAADYAAADAQAVLDKAAFDANFNVVYDTAEDSYDEETAFVGSRFANTMIYNTYSTNDIYFNDAVSANVVDVVQEDDSNFDIVFDTGAITRVNYLQVVSPIFHFADGEALAYDYAKKEFVSAYSGSSNSKPSTGAVSFDTADDVLVTSYDTAEDAPLAVSYYLAPIDNNQQTTDNQQDTANANKDEEGAGNAINATTTLTRTNDPAYEVSHEDFVISRANDGFINQVTANDDIWLVDTALENITDINVTANYDIIFTFDTGKQLRVRDNSVISPVFHLADGTTAVYNWSAIQWANVTDAADNNIADVFPATVLNNNFIRNAESTDYVYFDTTKDHVSDVYRELYYIVYTFDTGESTAVRYTDARTPTFVFADGSTSQWIYYDISKAEDTQSVEPITPITPITPATGETKTFTGSSYYSTVDKFSLDKNDNNIVDAVRDNDLITFTNATLSNVSNIEVTSDAVTFTFDNGATTTINYTSYYTPTIQFADGTGYQYYYSSYSGQGRSYNAYYGTDAADLFTLSGTNANRVQNVGAADTIFISDKNASDITYSYFSTSSYTPYIEFDFGNKYTYVYYNPDEGITPNIVFADGTSYQYNTYEPNYGEVDNILISRFNNNIVYYAEYEDYISVVDAGIANITEFGTDYNAKLTFDTGKTAFVGQYDTVSPLFLFADGSTLAYVNSTRTWATPIFATDDADNIPLSSANTNLIVNTASNDTIFIVDAARANITEIDAVDEGTLSITFDTGASTTVTYTGDVTPVIALTDGTIQYHIYEPTYDDDTFDLSIANNNILHSYVRENDTVNFTDAAISNVTATEFDSIGWDIEFTFNTGTTTYVEFDKSAGTTPTFNFADGSYRYITSYSSEAVKDVWQKYDTVSGTWQTTSEPVLTVYSSADLAESADLWGDTVDDNLFVDGTIAVDATLSDLVAAPVDNAAISFNAETAFDLTAAGGFIVASTATDSSQKTA